MELRCESEGPDNERGRRRAPRCSGMPNISYNSCWAFCIARDSAVGDEDERVESPIEAHQSVDRSRRLVHAPIDLRVEISPVNMARLLWRGGIAGSGGTSSEEGVGFATAVEIVDILVTDDRLLRIVDECRPALDARADDFRIAEIRSE